MISSSANGRVKQVMNLIKKAKARNETGLFVAEGARMVRELPPDRIESVFVSESFLKSPGNRRLLDSVRGIPTEEELQAEREKPGFTTRRETICETVTDEVFKTMSDTTSPQGILAVVKQYDHTLEDILNQPGPAFLMILETIQDPGNLGTILRAGEGAGITGVIMNEASADIYNPKVIRSTMGSVCRVPFVYTADLPGTLENLKRKGIRLYAAHLDGRNNYDKEDYTVNTGFLIGNEANGLSEEAASLADAYVKIPMKGSVESLNAAVAASVLMYEAARQRRVE